VDYLDLSRGHAELAIRAKAPTQPDLEVLAHLQVKLGVFASKEYAQRARSKGCKLKLADLDFIAWSYPNEHIEPNPTLQKLIPNFRPAFAANDYNVKCRAVAEGLGAMILARSHHHDQAFPPFEELDLGLGLPPADAYLVCAKTMRWVPRVRAVTGALIERLREIDGVEMLEL
jgi:DNA-binding transcriptional LysR family regulator